MGESEGIIEDAIEKDTEIDINSEQSDNESISTGKSDTHERNNDQRSAGSD